MNLVQKTHIALWHNKGAFYKKGYRATPLWKIGHGFSFSRSIPFLKIKRKKYAIGKFL